MLSKRRSRRVAGARAEYTTVSFVQLGLLRVRRPLACAGFTVSCVGIVIYRGAYFGIFDTFSSAPMLRDSGFLGKFALGSEDVGQAAVLGYLNVACNAQATVSRAWLALLPIPSVSCSCPPPQRGSPHACLNLTIDTIRRRIMMTSGSHGEGEAPKYRNSLHCLRSIVAEDGKRMCSLPSHG